MFMTFTSKTRHHITDISKFLEHMLLGTQAT